MADLLFGQSYYLRFDPKLWRAMEPYPPLGTMIAAACLRRRGFDVALFDAMLAGSEAEWAEALDHHRPRWAVLYEDNFNYLTKMCLSRMRRAAFTMIDAARERGVPVIVCGSDASDQPEAYLERGAEWVIVGEGERTLEELVQYLASAEAGAPRSPTVGRPQRAGPTGPLRRRVTEDGRPRRAGPTGAPRPDPSEIAGLAYLDPSGRLVRTAPRPVIRDLDALPLPAWDLVDVDDYRRRWLERHGRYSVHAVTTRGCPYHCNWCAKPIWGQTYNVRSPERVADELARLDRELAPDHVWFCDDIFGLKPGWTPAFAEALAERGVRIPFKCLSRADLLLRDGEAEGLARAGAESVWIGAESGSQEILDAMDKGTRVEQIREATRRLRAAGVRVGFFLQFGYPGEGREEIAATRRMVRDCRPDEIGISVSYPLPGTRFHEMVRREMGEKRHWVDSEDLAMMFAGTFHTRFYRQLYRVVHKERRARSAARRLARDLLRPWRLGPGHLRLAAAAAWHGATLPAAELRMRRLARLPGPGADGLDSGMSHDEAATPTPQGARGA